MSSPGARRAERRGGGRRSARGLCSAAFFDDFMGQTLEGATDFVRGEELSFFYDAHFARLILTQRAGSPQRGILWELGWDSNHCALSGALGRHCAATDQFPDWHVNAGFGQRHKLKLIAGSMCVEKAALEATYKFGWIPSEQSPLRLTPDVYSVKTSGPQRLVFAPSGKHFSILIDLLHVMPGPFGILYVLVVAARGGSEAGQHAYDRLDTSLPGSRQRNSRTRNA